MRITPLDLRNHRFRRRMAGYAPEEVDEFLRLVAEDYEAALRQIEAQRGQIVKLEARVDQLASTEQVLQDTLTTAQKLSEDLKRTAMKEAETMVSEAEIKGEKVLEAAHRRAGKLAHDIREMKLLKRRLAGTVRAVIQTHLDLLDGLAQDPAEESDAKVAYLAGAPRDPRPGSET